MNKGLRFSGIFYMVGLTLAGVSYLTLGHDYGHGPGLHHLIILATFALGLLLMIGALIKYWTGPRSTMLIGIIVFNFVMTLGFICVLWFLFRIESKERSNIEMTERKVRVEESGDTVTMYREGSIIYIRVKDSVLINFIDSLRINWDELERMKK